MKIKSLISLLVAATCGGFPLVLHAGDGGPYNLTWSTIDGGGSTSTGGVYAVSGTIGQPDAGTMSGGNYAIAGGFWGMIGVVPEPGAPALSVRFTNSNTVVLAWPNPSTGFVLQENTNLSTTNWNDTGASPVVVGGEKQVWVSPPVGSRFYRLRKSVP